MPLPLTFQQRSLWKLIEQHPGWQCSVAHAFSLRGKLNISALERSLDEIMHRHGSLRATISTDRGVPTFAIGEPRGCRLDAISVAGRSAQEITEHARELFAEFAGEMVDPTTGPLLNVRFLSLADNEHWLLVSVHRLIADCFSAEQTFHELWQDYRALAQNRASPLASDPPQYADYALWQQTHGQDWLLRHDDYWTQRLAGATSVQWPVDTEGVQSKRGATGMMSIHLGRALSDELHALARRTRSLAAMVMLSVYVSVLWRWCRQKDFILPFYVAGRRAEHKSVVGYFSHILYLRIELTGQETFNDVLGRVSNEFFRALLHQDFGRQASERPELLAGAFCQWVTWHTEPAQPETGAKDSGSMASELVVERLPLSEFGQGLSILPSGKVAVDLTFFDTAQGVYAQGVYRADRFRAGTLERLMVNLRAAAERFVRNPGASLTADFEA